MALKKKLMFLHLSISGPCLAHLRLISRDEQKKERDAGGKRFVLFPPFFCLLKDLDLSFFSVFFSFGFLQRRRKTKPNKKKDPFLSILIS